MKTRTFDVEKTSDESPELFMISVDDVFIDAEYTLEELIALRDRLNQTIAEEGGES